MPHALEQQVGRAGEHVTPIAGEFDRGVKQRRSRLDRGRKGHEHPHAVFLSVGAARSRAPSGHQKFRILSVPHEYQRTNTCPKTAAVSMLVPSGIHAKYRISQNAESPCNQLDAVSLPERVPVRTFIFAHQIGRRSSTNLNGKMDLQSFLYEVKLTEVTAEPTMKMYHALAIVPVIPNDDHAVLRIQTEEEGQIGVHMRREVPRAIL